LSCDLSDGSGKKPEPFLFISVTALSQPDHSYYHGRSLNSCLSYRPHPNRRQKWKQTNDFGKRETTNIAKYVLSSIASIILRSGRLINIFRSRYQSFLTH